MLPVSFFGVEIFINSMRRQNIHCSFEERQLAQKKLSKITNRTLTIKMLLGGRKNIFQTSNCFGTASSVWCPPSKAHSRRWQQASQEAPAAAAAATAKGQRIQISWQKKFQRQ